MHHVDDKLCAWVTLTDTWLGTLMDLIAFMEGIGQRKWEGRMPIEFCLEKE